MFNLLIILVMLGILVSLGMGLYFLVRDRGATERTVKSLSVRVALAFLLLFLLGLGFSGVID
jgi:hypothetical protein